MASFVSALSSFLKIASVLKSKAEKLSSKMYISGFLTIALAMESLCFCPPDTLEPPSVIISSNLLGLFEINS